MKNVHAENGEGGSGTNSSGRSGKDSIIEVPLGTIAKDDETGKKEAEILEAWAGNDIDARRSRRIR